MDEASLNRFDRIVAIMIQLQSKRIVKARELADRFQVSLRTIYRDIRSLEASGVPIISKAGVGYALMEGYRLPPVMFTREEAGSFVAAEKLMQNFTDKALGASYASAMYKIKSVLRGKEKDWIDTLESQVIVAPAHSLFNHNIPNALEICFESMAEKKQVFLHYKSFSAEEPSQRKIEPIGLYHENNHWYVMAYCHLRSAYRQFRTDRIILIERTNCLFQLEHHSFEALRQNDDSCQKVKVRISVDKGMAKYIQNSREYYGFVEEVTNGSQVEMTFMTSEIQKGFARWYLMFGDYATILEPEALKTHVAALIAKTSSRLQDSFSQK